MLYVKFLFQKVNFLLISVRVDNYMVTQRILCRLVHRLVSLSDLQVGAHHLASQVIKEVRAIYRLLLLKLRCRVEFCNISWVEHIGYLVLLLLMIW